MNDKGFCGFSVRMSSTSTAVDLSQIKVHNISRSNLWAVPSVPAERGENEEDRLCSGLQGTFFTAPRLNFRLCETPTGYVSKQLIFQHFPLRELIPVSLSVRCEERIYSCRLITSPQNRVSSGMDIFRWRITFWVWLVAVLFSDTLGHCDALW